MSADCTADKVDVSMNRQRGSHPWESVAPLFVVSENRASAPAPCCDRLDSWKEIAVYLKRSARCVQRWERHEDLPIHRHQHRRGATVYAFPADLDAWLRQRLPPQEIAAHERAAD